MKQCSKCRILKDESQFRKRKANKSGYGPCCKDCLKEYDKEYRADHLKEAREHRKTYSASPKRREQRKRYRNKELAYNRQWRKNNPIKSQAINKRYYAKRMEDPVKWLKVRLRTRLCQLINKKRIIKPESTMILLGCSIEFFKIFIELQFKEGMSWQNHSKYGWHLDHKIPLAIAKTQKDIRKLVHYTNIQPLWAFENWSKGSKVA